jgi:hypothetical protein
MVDGMGELKTKQGFFLCDLEGKGIPFCLLSVVETIERRRAMRRRLRQSSMAVGMASGGATAVRTSPTVVVYAGAPPPCGGMAWKWWLGFGLNSHGIGYYLSGFLYQTVHKKILTIS